VRCRGEKSDKKKKKENKLNPGLWFPRDNVFKPLNAKNIKCELYL
jgi:hypothetical protein